MGRSPVYLAQLRNWDGSGTPGGESCLIDGVPTLHCFEIVFSNILFLSGALFILALFVMFLYGSFSYLTSFGNPDKVKKAQATFKYAIAGLMLFVTSYLILRTIDFLFLGGTGTLFQFNIPDASGR
jgi:hypothetical protein